MTLAAQAPMEAAYNDYMREARTIPLAKRATDEALSILQDDVNGVFQDVIGTINDNSAPSCGSNEGDAFTQAARDAGISPKDLAEGSLAYVVFITSSVVDDPYTTAGFSSYLVNQFVHTGWAQQILLDKEIDWADSASDAEDGGIKTVSEPLGQALGWLARWCEETGADLISLWAVEDD
jgi:hypothetical protein